MLGSVHDAEDALQEALLRIWRALPRFEGRSSFRGWCYRVATNTCLDVINRRPKRVLPIDHAGPDDPHAGPREPLAERTWIEPYPSDPEAGYEQRESVELAFVAALQHLPATQRAVLVMREVLGFSAAETADSLDTTTASVNSALQRARSAVEQRVPEQSQQATLRALGDEALKDLVEGYVDAMERGDVPRVVAMLAEDAAWSMPPLASWYRGRADIEIFLREGPLSGRFRWRRLVTSANGQPAIAGYTWHEDERAYLPFVIDVLTLEGGRIKEVTAFIARSPEPLDPDRIRNFPAEPLAGDMFARFGLPDRLD
jgi:RNA polymerase sigma-70 factor (ECF subfamily)